MRVLIPAVFLAIPAAAEEARSCLPYADMVAVLAEFGEREMGTALSWRGAALLIFVNPTTGTYTLVALGADMQACVADSGGDFMFVDPTTLGEPS